MKEGGLPQLDPTWYASQLFWLTATFVLLYILMSRLIVPRIHEVLETRQNRISHDLDWAASLKAEAEDAKHTYEGALTEARGKAQSMLADAMQSIKKNAEAKGQELDRILADKLADSEKEIAQARKKAQDSLAPVAAEVTGLVLEKLLARKFDDKQLAALVGKISKEGNV